MTTSKRQRQVTVRLEINGTDEEWLSHWMWGNHREYLLQGNKAPTTHGVLVTGIFDDDLIKKNRELEAKLAKYEEEFGQLEETLDEDDS